MFSVCFKVELLPQISRLKKNSETPNNPVKSRQYILG